MTSERTGEEELRRLREDVAVPVESADVLAARRDRIVPRLEAMIEANGRRQRRERRVRATWIALGVAAAAALTWTAVRNTSSPTASSEATTKDAAPTSESAEEAAPNDPRPSTKTAILEDGEGALVDGAVAVRGAALGPGTRIRTGAAGAQLRLPSGARATLGADTALAIALVGASETALVLDRGRAELDVPPLAAGEQLRVSTEDAAVVVHGTRFTVEAGRREDGVAWTTVTVSRGEVGVLRTGAEELRLLAGQTWRSRPEVTEAPSPSASAAPELPSAARTARPSPSAPATSSASTSDLEEQNRAYGAAMKAKARGDHTGAASQLRVFLRRWPDSPLAGAARAELARAESSTHAP